MSDAKQIASEKIAECLALATRALKEAEKIATEAKLSFTWSGPGYGMGGRFDAENWRDSGCSDYDNEPAWRASSHSC